MINLEHIVFTLEQAVFCGLHPGDAHAIEYATSHGLEPIDPPPWLEQYSPPGSWRWFMKSFDPEKN